MPTQPQPLSIQTLEWIPVRTASRTPAPPAPISYTNPTGFPRISPYVMAGWVDAMPTWDSLSRQATGALLSAGVSRPEDEVAQLVEKATGRPPADQPQLVNRPAIGEPVATFNALLLRRLGGEPLAYIVGKCRFRGLDLQIDRRAFIPRPDTEAVAAIALDEVDRRGARTVVDLGTGSGAIGLSIATARRTIELWATDRSADALAVATTNRDRFGLPPERVRFRQGSWFEALPEELKGTVQVIVCNPPHLAPGDGMRPESAWEPIEALFGGPTGMEATTAVISSAHEWLDTPGSLVVEHSPFQSAAVVDLALSSGFKDAYVLPDFTGSPRAMLAIKQ